MVFKTNTHGRNELTDAPQPEGPTRAIERI
jgi:hypothetical protein